MPSVSPPLLEIRRLVVEFRSWRGTIRAIDDLSFHVDRGEVLGVVGESGAGKSLTGAAITGLLDPPGCIAGGEILLEGRRIDALPAEALRLIRGRRIGSIFQDSQSSLNPLLTVGDQLVETIRELTGLGTRAARLRAVELLDEVGIPSPDRRVDQYPHEFSGGMRQRVVIALALCGAPDLVIADEPTTALDVSVQAQILALLKRLARDHGMAIILITHDIGVVAEMCDRLAVLYAGRLAEIGPAEQVLERPGHPYTAGLMGAIPRFGDTADMLVQIPGTMPRLTAIPPGCAFHPRCPHAFDRCLAERPEPMAAADGSLAACWRVPERLLHA